MGTREPGTAPTDATLGNQGRVAKRTPDARAVALASLYGSYSLDFIVDMAQAVALDAVRRPLRYRAAENPALFYAARAEFGTTTNWLNPAQRAEFYASPFGQHPLAGMAAAAVTPFDMSSDAVRRAATKLASAVYTDAVAALFHVLEMEAQNFRVAVLEPWPQVALKEVAAGAKSNVERAASILGDRGVATAFSVEPITKKNWPQEIDAAGSELIAVVSNSLGASGARQLSSADFTNLQRVVEAGTRTIRLIGAHPDKPANEPVTEDGPLRELLAAGIAWHHSLAQVGGASRVGS